MSVAARATRLVALGERRSTSAGASAALRLLPPSAPQHCAARAFHRQARRALPDPLRRIQAPILKRWSSSPANETKKYTFEDLQSRIDASGSKPLVIIDVREPSELKQTGNIPGAHNLPVSTLPSHLFLSEEEFQDALGWPKPQNGDEVVFYCKSGVRSRTAAAMVVEEWGKQGVEVNEYPGSWLDWQKRGGETEQQ